MEVYEGKSVFGGVAIGKISVYTKDEQQVRRQRVNDTDAEVKRFDVAREAAIEQLGKLYEKAVAEVGEINAAVFEVHQMMLQDDDYIDSVKNIITAQSMNAEYAVAVTSENFSMMFSSMDDEYMKERATDVKDVSERVISNLLDGEKETVETQEPVIIIADDLAPSETVQMNKDLVLSFVTVHGSTNSHTAILARTMGIPAIVGTPLPLDKELDGKLAVVDGDAGLIYVEPDKETLKKLQSQLNDEKTKKELLKQMKGKESVTLDGQKMMLYANIGNQKDLALVLENDAEGIGLFRSEFLYLESDDYPSEEEQLKAYKAVAQTMAGKRVIIRTLDIGADKQVGYFDLPQEENPAMGMRAIRICLSRTEVFKTQLRALLRASAFGKIGIMYPMITSVNEVRQIKTIFNEVKDELAKANIPYGDVEQGIMIETPAAVMISDLLAKEVDFFSIGSNDLTQYTLAIDRQNNQLDAFYDSHSPAVLRMIQKTVESAHQEGIWCGICGELGADKELTKFFLSVGVDELSMSPGNILPVRKIIRETNVSEVAAEQKKRWL